MLSDEVEDGERVRPEPSFETIVVVQKSFIKPMKLAITRVELSRTELRIV